MSQKIADSLSNFLFTSPTPFHAVEQAKGILSKAGFCQLNESDSWAGLGSAQPGQGFFCLRGGSLIAWLCGSEAPWLGGLRLAGAHTDSPCFKLKLESAHFHYGVLACHVLVYGSPIFATYTDRSLAVAGIALTAAGHSRYIHSDQAVALMPNLAIHLNQNVNNKLSYNAQTQLKAVFGRQEQGLTASQLLRQKLGLVEDEVCELQLCNSQKPVLIGGELLSGGRLDDMSMVYLLLNKLTESKVGPKWPVAIFCNGEEVGSRTYEGAASNFVPSVLQRIVSTVAQSPDNEFVARTMARSFFLSLDGAHACHPSYPGAFDPNYEVKMGGGPALKLSNRASYSSEPFSIAQIRAIAQQANCHLQNSVPRSDKATGSTIGPILSSQLGIRGVDIGLPMYAMHSIQETVSLQDYLVLQKLVGQYYQYVSAETL